MFCFVGDHLSGVQDASAAGLCVVGARGQHRQWVSAALHPHHSPLEGDQLSDEALHAVKFLLQYIFYEAPIF